MVQVAVIEAWRLLLMTPRIAFFGLDHT